MAGSRPEKDSYNPSRMFKIVLILWVAAFLIGLLAGPKQRPLMGRLVFGGFCLLLLAALIRLLRI